MNVKLHLSGLAFVGLCSLLLAQTSLDVPSTTDLSYAKKEAYARLADGRQPFEKGNKEQEDILANMAKYFINRVTAVASGAADTRAKAVQELETELAKAKPNKSNRAFIAAFVPMLTARFTD